ncbi:hypothetical protein I6F66_02800 [Pseudoalteromonas sp. NZS100_1]|uniref:hypothetical protein n=1 Tax=Pseudoalteromonas sp. NZS100_1 TaxID=2792073 RepID=UPI0018CF9FE1|nr:hypothetical protein [Pseudoalteromonas sp. NZS100_1]MBH0011001.1 hypothetical protein [Pseudoalteromonas sp. NZS100_1]
MAIVNDKCQCGAKITVLTGVDKTEACYKNIHAQVVTTNDFNKGITDYTLFRCMKCGEPVEETVPALKPHP